MIAAATQSKLLFNWFDLVLVLLLGFGYWRGRKHGMTKELLPFLCWLSIIFAGGFGYRPLGNHLVASGIARRFAGQDASETTTAYIISYLLIAGCVAIVFLFVKSRLKARMEGSSYFGSSEYYLGMASGVLRYASIAIFALALLHAPYYSQAEIEAQQAYNNRWYGGGLKDFKGDYLPSLGDIQTSVFHNSLFGPFVDKGLRPLLIDSRPAEEAGPPPAVDIQQ